MIRGRAMQKTKRQKEFGTLKTIFTPLAFFKGDDKIAAFLVQGVYPLNSRSLELVRLKVPLI
ncbi:hypothetical protein COP00_01900 [Bacillus glycinifermentans]|mgnify:CR=1 FL=1|uniref:Uncharacterized protein n=1 Tax=Bacillus glycinifermentans TaxID=1664069 RepID=A0A0T6BQM1_9BACI|nr:hypothetical protein COP00_01900 [Bacillus glycinifermentans]KRT93935.1 hypothetical protein AB447_216450 [Bacillus glycinifermentans]